MRDSNYSVKEYSLIPGIRCVELENDHISVVILPDKGADIYSISYKKKDNLNVLFRSPWRPRVPGAVLHPGTSEEQWMDYYHGGWQFMFPNAGGECRYKGATMGFHGEASAVPWDYRIEMHSGNPVIVLTAPLTRTPFFIERTVRLEEQTAKVFIKDKVTNLGEEPMEYVWGQHIAFGAPFLSEHCTLFIPNDKLVSDPQQGANSRLSPGQTTSWPLTAATRSGAETDFSKIPAKSAKLADMAYLTGLQEGWYVLSNAEIGLSAKVSWDIAAFPYVWLWQEFGGSFEYPFHGRCYVMGVEPCSTPISGGLAESVERGFAYQLAPLQARETEISLTLFEGNFNAET